MIGCGMMKWILKLKQMISTLMAMTALQIDPQPIPIPTSIITCDRSLIAESVIDNAPEDITAERSDDKE